MALREHLVQALLVRFRMRSVPSRFWQENPHLEAPGGKIVQGLFYPKRTELAPSVLLADVHPVQHNLPFGQVNVHTSRMVLGSLILMVVVPHGFILSHMNLIRMAWHDIHMEAGKDWLHIAKLPEDSF